MQNTKSQKPNDKKADEQLKKHVTESTYFIEHEIVDLKHNTSKVHNLDDLLKHSQKKQ